MSATNTPAVSAAEQEIDKLMALHPKGFDLSLDRIRRLLEVLGNPHEKLPPVIHIAGTNGKGSATAFCRALLEAAGLAVHVHTSPHLVAWHERYRIGVRNGRSAIVDDELFADALRRVAAANAGQTITVFEILTAVTFLSFSSPNSRPTRSSWKSASGGASTRPMSSTSPPSPSSCRFRSTISLTLATGSS